MSSLTTLRRASSTFQNAIAKRTDAEDIRAQLGVLDELKRELGKRQDALRDAALTLGLARHGIGSRETAPNRVAYIKLHGLDAWTRDHKATSVRKFVWV